MGLGLAFAGPLLATLALTGAESAVPGDRTAPPKSHRIAFQVNSDDPATTMKHAISNALNAIKTYEEKNEPVAIEIVTYGSGIHMFRADTSPVKDLLPLLRAHGSNVVLSMCGITKSIMEQREGLPLVLVEGAHVVSSGVVRLADLQEAGWSYIRP